MYFCIKFQEKQPDMDTKKTLTVKHWADGDKPREKMIQQGKKQHKRPGGLHPCKARKQAERRKAGHGDL